MDPWSIDDVLGFYTEAAKKYAPRYQWNAVLDLGKALPVMQDYRPHLVPSNVLRAMVDSKMVDCRNMAHPFSEQVSDKWDPPIVSSISTYVDLHKKLFIDPRHRKISIVATSIGKSAISGVKFSEMRLDDQWVLHKGELTSDMIQSIWGVVIAAISTSRDYSQVDRMLGAYRKMQPVLQTAQIGLGEADAFVYVLDRATGNV